jgi:hypothetical protein
MGTVESERDAVTARTGKNFAEHTDLHNEEGTLPG